MKKQTKEVQYILNEHSELLIKAISNLIYLDPEQVRNKPMPLHRLYRRLSVETEARDKLEHRRSRRIEGRDWPAVAHSMTGYKRLRNLADCVLDVMKNGVKGDFIETGVWRGGSCILVQGLLRAANQMDRKVYVADSFAGLPPPNDVEFPADKNDPHHLLSDHLGVSLEQVQENFNAYGFLDDNVVFVKGWFKDTLPALDAEEFSIIRLDGDMYESTIQAIEALYPKLSVGGFLIVDDYGGIRACRKAITDYRNAHGITEEIIKIDRTGVYWKKGGVPGAVGTLAAVEAVSPGARKPREG